jgi:acetyltransferase-like isoleucine patch superfamily enzyme
LVNLRFVILTLARGYHLPLGKYKIGKHCTGTPIVYSNHPLDKVTIGDYCSIGPNVLIIPSMGHIPDKKFGRQRLSTATLTNLTKNGWKEKYWLPGKGDYVNIGNDVWIGARAIIMPSVTIGHGSIIGAGSVVTRDIPPYSVVAGVPAKVIRCRYNPDEIEKLLAIAWWNWSEKKIIENLDYFYDDVKKFLDKFWTEDLQLKKLIPK